MRFVLFNFIVMNLYWGVLVFEREGNNGLFICNYVDND